VQAEKAVKSGVSMNFEAPFLFLYVQLFLYDYALKD
jgi:hypothetical protein